MSYPLIELLHEQKKYSRDVASVSSSSYLWLNTNTIAALDYTVAYSYLLRIVITYFAKIV